MNKNKNLVICYYKHGYMALLMYFRHCRLLYWAVQSNYSFLFNESFQSVRMQRKIDSVQAFLNEASLAHMI